MDLLSITLENRTYVLSKVLITAIRGGIKPAFDGRNEQFVRRLFSDSSPLIAPGQRTTSSHK